MLAQARARACAVGRADGIVSALQHGEESDEGDRALVRDAAAWIARYDAFAASAEAQLLADYATLAAMVFPGAYPDETCRILKPVLAVALSADVLRSRGGTPRAGPLLNPTKDAPLPPAIHLVGERCDFRPFEVPPPPLCN